MQQNIYFYFKQKKTTYEPVFFGQIIHLLGILNTLLFNLFAKCI